MSNKNIREQLEKRYGKECFIEKLHLRKESEPRKYTSVDQMKRMKQLTYHHIKMKKDGGQETIENGVLLSNENHIWFHQQSKVAQGYMNAIFQEYKRQADECKVVFTDDLIPPYQIRAIDFSIDEKGKYNRAKKKNIDKELIKEWEEER